MTTKDEINIFIVDDDKMLVKALKNEIEKTFPKLNPVVTAFESGEECQKSISSKPTLAIVDYHLDSKIKNAMDGVKTIDMIKKHSPNTEVIMFTSEEKADVAVKAMHHGAHDYIVKNEHMFRKLNMSILQCLKLKDLKNEVSKSRIRVMILLFIVVAIIAAVVALQIWAPGLMGKVDVK